MRYKVYMLLEGLQDPIELADPSTESLEEAEMLKKEHEEIADHIYSPVERKRISFTIITLPF